MRLLLLFALAAPSDAFSLPSTAHHPARPASRAFLHATAEQPPLQTPPADNDLLDPRPVPTFKWSVVAFFAANPVALSPLALIAALVFKINVVGANCVFSPAVLQLGALWSLPMLAFSALPLERIVPALKEINVASKVITLYALGGRLVPLRAAAGSVIISTSAAVCEELAFRGALQTAFANLLMCASVPARSAGVAALALQALVFGKLHSYSSSPAYLIAATCAGLAFGAAYTLTANIWVPMIMHFFVDVVAFAVCHVQVTRATKAAQGELIDSSLPLAASMRAVFYGRPQKSSDQQQQKS